MNFQTLYNYISLAALVLFVLNSWDNQENSTKKRLLEKSEYNESYPLNYICNYSQNDLQKIANSIGGKLGQASGAMLGELVGAYIGEYQGCDAAEKESWTILKGVSLQDYQKTDISYQARQVGCSAGKEAGAKAAQRLGLELGRRSGAEAASRAAKNISSLQDIIESIQTESINWGLMMTWQSAFQTGMEAAVEIAKIVGIQETCRQFKIYEIDTVLMCVGEDESLGSNLPSETQIINFPAIPLNSNQTEIQTKPREKQSKHSYNKPTLHQLQVVAIAAGRRAGRISGREQGTKTGEISGRETGIISAQNEAQRLIKDQNLTSEEQTDVILLASKAGELIGAQVGASAGFLAGEKLGAQKGAQAGKKAATQTKTLEEAKELGSRMGKQAGIIVGMQVGETEGYNAAKTAGKLVGRNITITFLNQKKVTPIPSP